jgi:hypothetical protein
MHIKYRIQVRDQICEVDHVMPLGNIVTDLVKGRSKLGNCVRPEDIHITVFEAEPEPEVEQWRKTDESA